MTSSASFWLDYCLIVYFNRRHGITTASWISAAVAFAEQITKGM